MESDDDMIVIIVGEGQENKLGTSKFPFPINIKQEILDEIEMSTIETLDEEATEDRLDECTGDFAVKVKKEVKVEYDSELPLESFIEDGLAGSDDEYVPEEEDYPETEYLDKKQRRIKQLKPWQRKSFVADLREEYEDLEDEELLINCLAAIMRTMKPPPPPQDYYMMNGIMFECVLCSTLSDTIPAAGRHYQEKHGPRYLLCFACGADFRSTTNLYKHEKRCEARDAVIVLKARAISVGNKGRHRPYLPDKNIQKGSADGHKKGKNKLQRFTCDLCPAAFQTKSALISHGYLHNGLRPYRCTICPSAYTSHSALSRHLKKHSDIKYICDHCGRAFNVKTALVSHMDTHLPYRKHECKECGRRFAQKNALALHVDGRHRRLPPPCACQICPKRFRRMTILKDHMKKDHGLLLMTRKMFFKKLPTMTENQIQQAKLIFKSDEEITDSQYFVQPKDVNEEFLSYVNKKFSSKPEIDLVEVKLEPAEGPVNDVITNEETEDVKQTFSDLSDFLKE